MSSPADPGRRRAFPLFPGGAVLPALLLALLSSLVLNGCAGYRLAADSPSIFGSGMKTLKIKEVDYPTLQPWLPYRILSLLRDEIAARNLAVWVDSGPADFEIQINVISYTSREWMRDEDDRTMLFSNSMTLEAIVYSGSANTEVWRSGRLSYSDRDENSDARLAVGDIVTQIVRMLADKMRETF
ncbi:MAG: LPS assembly lipoprotein LptE [Desulfovibrio sp.]|jgi:hypothetical protein|nr:LPS assembly lipoprotein LptE [Desulfovibrio sp.]